MLPTSTTTVRFGPSVRADDADVEPDREQDRLAGPLLGHDAAVDCTVAEPLVVAAVAVVVDPCFDSRGSKSTRSSFLPRLRNLRDADPLKLPVPAHQHDMVIRDGKPIETVVHVNPGSLSAGVKSVIDLPNIVFPDTA